MAAIDAVRLERMSRLYQSLNAAIAVESRQLDELTPAEVALETQWQRDLQPVLADLYWYPLRNGIQAAPEDEDELRRWLRQRLVETAATAALLALLNRYMVRSFNIGGGLALQLLGLAGAFNLTDREILAELEDHAEELVTPGTDLSLVDTTEDHLVTGILAARESEDNTVIVLAGMIAAWALWRSMRIAATEQSRGTAWGLQRTYSKNGVMLMDFMTRADDRVCPQCRPLHGRRMPVNNIPADLVIPVHVECRCYYLGATAGWTPPPAIWRG